MIDASLPYWSVSLQRRYAWEEWRNARGHVVPEKVSEHGLSQYKPIIRQIEAREDRV